MFGLLSILTGVIEFVDQFTNWLKPYNYTIIHLYIYLIILLFVVSCICSTWKLFIDYKNLSETNLTISNQLETAEKNLVTAKNKIKEVTEKLNSKAKELESTKKKLESKANQTLINIGGDFNGILKMTNTDINAESLSKTIDDENEDKSTLNQLNKNISDE